MLVGPIKSNVDMRAPVTRQGLLVNGTTYIMDTSFSHSVCVQSPAILNKSYVMEGFDAGNYTFTLKSITKNEEDCFSPADVTARITVKVNSNQVVMTRTYWPSESLLGWPEYPLPPCDYIFCGRGLQHAYANVNRLGDNLKLLQNYLNCYVLEEEDIIYTRDAQTPVFVPERKYVVRDYEYRRV